MESNASPNNKFKSSLMFGDTITIKSYKNNKQLEMVINNGKDNIFLYFYKKDAQNFINGFQGVIDNMED